MQYKLYESMKCLITMQKPYPINMGIIVGSVNE